MILKHRPIQLTKVVNSNFIRHFSINPISRNAENQFPWLLSKDDVRLEKQPYFHSGTNPFTSWLPKSWQDSLFSYMVIKFIGDYTNMDYFDDEFVMGATLASDQVTNAITTGNLDAMLGIMTPELYERYKVALEQLSQHNQAVEIAVTNPEKSRVLEYWATIGPHAGLDVRNTQYDVNFVRSAILISKAKSPEGNGFAGSVRSVTKDYTQGLQLEVDMSIEADITYRLIEKPSEANPEPKVLLEDKTRRELVLTFKSQLFEPIPAEVFPQDWDWKLSDIDYLLRSENLETRTKWFYQHKQNFINHLKNDQNE